MLSATPDADDLILYRAGSFCFPRVHQDDSGYLPRISGLFQRKPAPDSIPKPASDTDLKYGVKHQTQLSSAPQCLHFMTSFTFHKHPVGRAMQFDARRDIQSRRDIERDQVPCGTWVVRSRFDQCP